MVTLLPASDGGLVWSGGKRYRGDTAGFYEGAATVGIGLLPTYQQIGIWAPVLLVLLRLIQGLGIGGEWGGALLLAYEFAPPKSRGLFGSVPQMGVTIGMLLAVLAIMLMSLLPDGQFLS